jgi:hypothetical protein
MNKEHIDSALLHLAQKHTGEYCWCGNGRGHSLTACHYCGQPFKPETLTKAERFKRILSNRRSHRGWGGWESLTANTFSTWRFLDCQEGTLEEYRAAFSQAVCPEPLRLIPIIRRTAIVK